LRVIIVGGLFLGVTSVWSVLSLQGLGDRVRTREIQVVSPEGDTGVTIDYTRQVGPRIALYDTATIGGIEQKGTKRLEIEVNKTGHPKIWFFRKTRDWSSEETGFVIALGLDDGDHPMLLFTSPTDGGTFGVVYDKAKGPRSTPTLEVDDPWGKTVFKAP